MSKAQCPQISGTLLVSWDYHWLSESIHPASKMCLISSQQVTQADTNPAGSHLIKNSWSHPVSEILPMTWKSNSHRKFWYLHRLRWKCRQQSYFDLSLQRSLVLFLNRDELSEFSSPEINMRKTFPLSTKVYQYISWDISALSLPRWMSSSLQAFWLTSGLLSLPKFTALQGFIASLQYWESDKNLSWEFCLQLLLFSL